MVSNLLPGSYSIIEYHPDETTVFVLDLYIVGVFHMEGMGWQSLRWPHSVTSKTLVVYGFFDSGIAQELYQPFTKPSVVLDAASLKCTSSHPKKLWFMMISTCSSPRQMVPMGPSLARPQFVACLVCPRHGGTFQRSTAFHSIDLFVLLADGSLGFAWCKASANLEPRNGPKLTAFDIFKAMTGGPPF